MQASNALFESEIPSTPKLLSRSLDVGLWRAQSTKDEEQKGFSSCESPSAVDQCHWSGLLTFRSQTPLQTPNKDDLYEPTSPRGYFLVTPSRDDTVHHLHDEGDNCRYSPSNDSCGKDQCTAKTIVKFDEIIEGQKDSNDAKDCRLLLQSRPRGVNSEDHFSEFQNDKSQKPQLQTQITHKTESKRQKKRANSTGIATTRACTASDLHGTSPSSNTQDSEHNDFRRLTIRTNTSRDDQPTIAQLWAQESQNNPSFRRYRGTSFKNQREQSGSDHEAYFHLIDLGSHTKRSLHSAKDVGGFFPFAYRGMARRESAREFSEQRSRLFELATMPFDHSNDRHVSILREIYRIYTGDQRDSVETIGEHWKELGFQGTDPALELRSGGILTLLFLLYFHKKDPLVATAILQETKQDGGVYPFASMCVLVTTWVLRAIKERNFMAIVKDMEVNNKEWIENKEDWFILAAKKLFTGLIYKFHWNVTRQQGGIIDLLGASDQVERELKKDVELVLRIADLPDILQLGEHLFRPLTSFQQIKQTVKLSFTCFQPKDLGPDEEHS